MFTLQFPRSEDIGFKQVPQTEDCESLASEHKDAESLQISTRSSLYSQLYLIFISCLALASAALLGARFGGRFFLDTERLCISQVSKYCG